MIQAIKDYFEGRSTFFSDQELPQAIAKRYFASVLASKLRIKTYKKLARLMEHDVPLIRAVGDLKTRALKRGATDFEALALQGIEQRLRNGLAPGNAFESFVPSAEGVILQSYESDFIQGLRDCARAIEDASRIRAHVTSAIAAPFLYVILLLAVMYLYGAVVIPKIALVLPPEQWTGSLKGLSIISAFVTSSWFWVFLVALVSLFFLFFWSLPRLTGGFRAFLDRYPPYSIYRVLVGAGMLQSLASLMMSGLSVPQSLERMQRLSKSNPWLHERITSTLFYLRDGDQLGDAFYKTKLCFPDPELIEDLKLYATLDHFDQTLMDVARTWTEESIENVSRTSKVLNNMLLLLVGGFMAFMALGILGIGSRISDYLSMSHMM
jgi:type II secretory pathway component PulF